MFQSRSQSSPQRNNISENGSGILSRWLSSHYHGGIDDEKSVTRHTVNLLTSTIKVDAEQSDLRFCFRIISPMKIYTLQVPSQNLARTFSLNFCPCKYCLELVQILFIYFWFLCIRVGGGINQKYRAASQCWMVMQAENALDQMDWIEKINGVIASLLSSQAPERVNFKNIF